MSGYTKLFSLILDSTVWETDLPVKVMWITMLAMADQDGIVEASVPSLAKRAGVSREECERALTFFLSPDPDSRTKDNEGRRIESIDGGWKLLNHAKYRHRASLEDIRLKAAERQRRLRALKKAQSRDVTDVTLGHASNDIASPSHRIASKITKPSRPSDSGPSEDFDGFWAMYPKRQGKASALKAWAKLNPNADLVGVMLSALAWQVKQDQWTKDGGQFVPHASTWINGRRWEDEVIKPKRAKTMGPDYAESADWYEQCKAKHGGACESRYQHEMKA